MFIVSADLNLKLDAERKQVIQEMQVEREHHQKLVKDHGRLQQRMENLLEERNTAKRTILTHNNISHNHSLGHQQGDSLLSYNGKHVSKLDALASGFEKGHFRRAQLKHQPNAFVCDQHCNYSNGSVDLITSCGLTQRDMISRDSTGGPQLMNSSVATDTHLQQHGLSYEESKPVKPSQTVTQNEDDYNPPVCATTKIVPASLDISDMNSDLTKQAPGFYSWSRSSSSDSELSLTYNSKSEPTCTTIAEKESGTVAPYNRYRRPFIYLILSMLGRFMSSSSVYWIMSMMNPQMRSPGSVELDFGLRCRFSM